MCDGTNHEQNYCEKVDIVEENCILLSSARLFETRPSLEMFTDILAHIVDSMTKSNPWTLAASLGVPISTDSRSYKRGGVVQHFSRPIGHDPDSGWWICSNITAKGYSNPFSANILLSTIAIVEAPQTHFSQHLGRFGRTAIVAGHLDRLLP